MFYVSILGNLGIDEEGYLVACRLIYVSVWTFCVPSLLLLPLPWRIGIGMGWKVRGFNLYDTFFSVGLAWGYLSYI